MTNENLLSEKIAFENLKKGHKGYSKKAYPSILNALKEFIATGQYPYNATVKDFIATKYDIKESLHDYLETEVYLAQQDLTEENNIKQQQDMADKGYVAVSLIKGFTGNVELVATKSNDWSIGKISTTGKIITASNGEPFFVPKGKRSRGYYLRYLENAYYKAI